MRQYFSCDKAIKEIGDNKVVKMLSSDFKTHLFKRAPKNYQKPVTHIIQKTLGKPMYTNMSYDEFKEKYKDNEFFVYEDAI